MANRKLEEPSLTCPQCGHGPFTGRGLKTHNCAKRQAHPESYNVPSGDAPRAVILAGRGKKPVCTSAAITLQTLAVIPADQDKLMGQQLTEQYGRAVGGMRDVMVFGAMMIQLEATVSARGHGGKFGEKGEGVKGWLERHAPSVNRQTAYRFKAVTEAIQEDYIRIVGAKAAKAMSLADLATTPADKLPEPLRAKQLSLFEYVQGTSQRSWLDRLKPIGSRGGKTYDRENGKGARKRLTPEEATALLQLLCEQTGEKLAAVHSERAFIALNDAELDGLTDHCATVLDAVKAWRRLTKTERQSLLAEQIARQLRGE